MNPEIETRKPEPETRRGLRARRPSAGFVLLAGSFVLVGGFFLWALREPELDRVWRMLHEMKIGVVGRLSDADLERLHRTLARYPELGPSLLDGRPAGMISANTGGWVETERAYLLASPETERDPVVTLHWRPETDRIPGPVVLRGIGADEVVVLETPGAVSVGLSKALRAGGLIEVRVDAPPGSAGPGLAAGLQIIFSDGKR